MKPPAIIVCVEYDDYLRLTLPRTLEHFDPLVVTTREDTKTQQIAIGSDVEVICVNRTDKDLHYDKGHAIDWGLKYLDEPGWIAVLDADILLPKQMDLSTLEPGCIHSPHRRIVSSYRDYLIIKDREEEWYEQPYGPEIRNGEYAGYFQMFQWEDPVLDHPPPWYENDEWTSYQGCDTHFWRKWMPDKMRRLPFQVLHLGPLRVNWQGRISNRWDN